ncbi:MAG: pH regulation protein F [Planctomycetes bacterium]|nr:pH regulation protein F [Planctomycetota bacterium]
MFAAASIAILVAILLYLVRALLGPTAFDRILATNALGTKTVILVSLLGFVYERPDFLDIALVYALINFLATLAILKFIEYQRLG